MTNNLMKINHICSECIRKTEEQVGKYNGLTKEKLENMYIGKDNRVTIGCKGCLKHEKKQHLLYPLNWCWQWTGD